VLEGGEGRCPDRATEGSTDEVVDAVSWDEAVG
jgi:hypothetical protein